MFTRMCIGACLPYNYLFVQKVAKTGATSQKLGVSMKPTKGSIEASYYNRTKDTYRQSTKRFSNYMCTSSTLSPVIEFHRNMHEKTTKNICFRKPDFECVLPSVLAQAVQYDSSFSSSAYQLSDGKSSSVEVLLGRRATNKRAQIIERKAADRGCTTNKTESHGLSCSSETATRSKIFKKLDGQPGSFGNDTAKGISPQIA